jgi:hypothetical protein
MDALDFLHFNADFSSPRVVAVYDELPLWSAMFGVLLRATLRFGPFLELVSPRCRTRLRIHEAIDRTAGYCSNTTNAHAIAAVCVIDSAMDRTPSLAASSAAFP